MARQLRIDYPGAWHHVMNRGRRKFPIFLCDEDRQSFLGILSRASERHGIRINGYCLMGNHYHLVVQTPTAVLSNALRYIDSGYAQQFNSRHGFDGPVFRGRFRSKLIDSDGYLENVVRYVHRNPVGLVGIHQLADYQWSSYPVFLQSKAHWPAWLHPDAIWSNGKITRSELIERTEDSNDPEDFDFHANPKAIGSETFVQAALAAATIDDQTIGHLRSSILRPSVGQITQAVSAVLSARAPSAIQLSKFDLKLITLGLSQELGGKSLAELAKQFGYSSSQSAGNATHRFRKRLDNEEYALAVEQVRKELGGFVVDERCR